MKYRGKILTLCWNTSWPETTLLLWSDKETVSISVQSHLYRYIYDVLSINIQEFENGLGQMYPAELKIKDTAGSITSASYLDLLRSIWKELPFTTNEMIFISTSQTFRSLVVIFHLRPPNAFLSLSFYDTPGLDPRMNVLFWGPGELLKLFLPRGTLEIVIQGSFIVDTQIFFSNMKSPLTSYSDSKQIRLSTNFMTVIPSLTFTELRVVFMEHL